MPTSLSTFSIWVVISTSSLRKVQGVKLSGVSESINFINIESANGNQKGIKGTVDSLISYSPLFSKLLFKFLLSVNYLSVFSLVLSNLNKIIPLRPRGKAVMLSQDKSTMGFLSEKISASDSLKDIVSYVFSDTLLVSYFYFLADLFHLLFYCGDFTFCISLLPEENY